MTGAPFATEQEVTEERVDVNVDGAKELERLSHEVVEAIGRKNAVELGSILDDGFAHLSSDNQRQTKEEFVRAIIEGAYTIDEIGFDSLRVECRGEVGVAAGIQRARGHLPDGTSFLSVGAFTDVFRRTDGGWRLWLANSVELPSS
jgi:ketosteroid isomerase-like protein